MFPIWAIDLFLFCFRTKMKTITVLKDKIRNEADLGVDLEADLEAVGVVSKEDVTRVVVAVLEVDAAAIGVDVGTIVMIEVVAEIVVVLGVVAEIVVVLEVVAVVIEVVLMVENLGVETTGIATDQENRGEMTTMIEEVLRVVSIIGNLSIFRHHLKIKRSLLTINVEYIHI